MSLSARRAWIEIGSVISGSRYRRSLSARRAWIEIVNCQARPGNFEVALRKESVDRNRSVVGCLCIHGVALRKESVDRNMPSH